MHKNTKFCAYVLDIIAGLPWCLPTWLSSSFAVHMYLRTLKESEGVTVLIWELIWSSSVFLERFAAVEGMRKLMSWKETKSFKSKAKV